MLCGVERLEEAKLNAMTPNLEDSRWAHRAVQALLTRCFRALAKEASANGRTDLAKCFIALACGLGGGSK